VLLTLMTGALGASAGQEAFQQGGVNEVRGQLDGAQEMGFALAQREGGETLDFGLLLIYMCSKSEIQGQSSKCESAPGAPTGSGGAEMRIL